MASSTLGLNSSPPDDRLKYDVFLSFRGEDTRKGFVSHLYEALENAGVKTFHDDAPRDISPELKAAIQNSRTAITFLGENYATSPWALEELDLILKSHGKRKTVLPIFYNVDPSDVRYQTGSFAEAFARHEETYKDDPDKVRRWRAALNQVANLAGWDSRGRDESELIEEIVNDIWRKLHPTAKTSAPCSSPFSSHKRKYEVFMCFRGKDTRLNFVGHTYASLKRKGITTFKDDKGLEKGQSISPGIVKAIEESQIYLVTLSPDFASSTWCLDELVKMFECMETSNSQRSLEDFTERKEASTVATGIKCNTRDRKISKVRISVHYDGEWVSTAYVGGKAKEIVVSKDITCEELLRRVYRLVRIDQREYEIIMKTTDESKSPAQPVQIVDDEHLAFFIEQSLSLDKSLKMNIPKPKISSSRTRRKMNELRLLVNYGGKWSNSIYIGGKTKGITVSDSITYKELVQKLYNALEVNPSEYTIIVTTAYGSKLPTRPVELIDDDDLTFLIDESLSLGEGSKVPLFITLQRRLYRSKL
ncbi:hypothetical protein DVH24_038576 [Malus domestica]|uniref:TIR domain-containing protein n=1 Tax=Malus domestica TaxID=3750 RepID=A0A498KFG1_MALDO|nr:hypothetical protein DVH24_038576 [Malus domestica]